MDGSPATDRIARLIELAGAFARERHHAEAADLYALVLHLAPGHAEARRGLERIRRAQRRAGQGKAPTLREAAAEEFRRAAIDGAHFAGLAELYAQRQHFAAALDCLGIAEEKAPANPVPHKLHGIILYRRKDYDGAVRQLEQALRLDPFDREAVEMLGLAESERRRFEAAVAATIHAFLLLPALDSEVGDRLRRRLQTLKRILGWDNRRLQEVFHRQRERLETAFDRLEWRRGRPLEHDPLPRGGAVFGGPPRQRRGLIELAARLRRQRAWTELSDEQLFRLAGTVQEELHDTGSVIYTQGSPGADLYTIERGEVAVQRPTSYGTFRLRVLPAGELLGDAGFLSRRDCADDAVATCPTSLLRCDGAALDELLSDTPDLAARLLGCLWQSLAGKLRESNEQLRQIFAGAVVVESPRAAHPEAAGEKIEIDPREKIEIFREQGLSHRELMVLATFSRERRYAEGEHLFREGEPGEELFAIVEGRALISKFIPGGGDEALAILGRGEFFGEMALIEGQPRSADARAYGGPLTVLTVDGKTLRELFTLDAAASLEFLRVLCRLMTRRLAEIDEKVVTWQILDGYRRQAGVPMGQ